MDLTTWDRGCQIERIDSRGSFSVPLPGPRPCATFLPVILTP